MTWINPEPKSTGWYLCTIKENDDYRYVIPFYRAEYPKGNFYWTESTQNLRIVACIKFPKPYGGEAL